MLDCTALAQATVDYLQPFLAAAGGAMLRDGLDLARESVFTWLKSKFVKPAQSAVLDEVRANPNDKGAVEALSLQLRRLLEENEELRKELLERLPKEIVPPGINQTATITGNGGTVIQQSGSGSIDIRR